MKPAAAVRCTARPARAPSPRAGRWLARRGPPPVGRGAADVRIEPARRRGDQVHRHRRSVAGSAARSASRRACTASASAGFSGPRFEPAEFAALYGIGEVADGRLQKCFGSTKAWPISAEPTVRRRARPSCRWPARERRAARCRSRPADGQAGEQRQQPEEHEGGSKVSLHHERGSLQARPSAASARSMILMPMNGTITPPRP